MSKRGPVKSTAVPGNESNRHTTARFLAIVAAVLSLLAPTILTGQTLEGTQPLKAECDLAAQMVEGIKQYLARETAESRGQRASRWKPDFSSTANYDRSVSLNRERLSTILGVVDLRDPNVSLVFDARTPDGVSRAGESSAFTAYRVRWNVFDGMTAEGLLLEPRTKALARIVAIPDANTLPEQFAGLEPGVPAPAQFARRLAEHGCQVLVPQLINRDDTWSGNPRYRMTNQPHREYLYRMSFEVGRHVIGYEIQKALAAIDWFAGQRSQLPIGVVGYGEGGMLALYSAALDTRIQAAVVSGYFQPRETLWKEPIYRDVWGLLREFGDAEIASLIAPRALIVEASDFPKVNGPPAARDGRANSACPNGALVTPAFGTVRDEVERSRPAFEKLKAGRRLQVVNSKLLCAEETINTFLEALNLKPVKPQPSSAPHVIGPYDRAPRQKRQFEEMVRFTQDLVARSAQRRAEFWAKADTSSPAKWNETSQFYRDYIWDEVIGRMPSPSVPANPRTRLIYDAPKFRGYEVMLDVWPDVFAYGILLVPRGIQGGERRPVVVCQHGLEGRPQDVADPSIDSPYYHHFGASLADEGFVVFAPQNPYIGEDRFRIIQRMAHPLKLTLFSFILGQQQRTLEWLGGLPFVDAKRIGFYGLSYGGKAAMRVPPLIPGFALSICSADFNEWVWKNTRVDSEYSYLLTKEYDMIEFNLANVANYAELAMLMAPRPFMVERGHGDPVAPDEWVAYEYSKVRRFYTSAMHAPDKTEIEFFDGPHTIHGKGTFEFLRRHLNWPVQPRATQESR